MQDGAGAAVQSEDHNALPSTRAEALALGAKTYFDGKKCRNGHVSPRRADEGKCVACINQRASDRRAKNPEHVKALRQAWLKENHEHVKASKRQSYAANKEKIRAAARARYAANPEYRAKVAATNAAWAAANPERKKEADRRWVQENRERHNAHGRVWRQNNPERIRELYNRRRLRRGADTGFRHYPPIVGMTLAERRAIYYGPCRPASREEALALGYGFYWSSPCPRNHSAPRRAENGDCVQCNRERARAFERKFWEYVRQRKRAYRAKNFAIISLKNKERYLANWEQHKLWRQRHYLANREKILAANRKWAAQHPDKIREISARWARNNPEKVAASARRYQSSHREQVRENTNRWHRNNRDKINVVRQRRRARQMRAEGVYTHADIVRIRIAQKGRCAICRGKHKLTVDHIIALSKGGSNWPSNIQLLCTPCNSAKHANDPIEFMQSRGYLL